MRALATGATGFIGRALLRRLEGPVVLTRDPAGAKGALGGAAVLGWQPDITPAPAEALRGVEVVFHLAGESVASGRWNAAKKARIRDSRVLGTRNLVTGIERSKERPRVLVSASAVGYYGSRGEEELDEGSAPGDDFLAKACRDWEAEAAKARALGVRVVLARIGVVLGKGGGALARMLPPFRLGLGGPLGSGRQWFPWIHLDDVVGLLLHAAERGEVDGALNVVAPQPATNREFTRALAAALRRPAILPVPAFALRLALGEFAGVLLGSQKARPRAAERTGYRFRHPSLAGALQDLVSGS
ncbi:MAG: TIGR01777 family oxidoreductase [Planctomycetota bacterium]